MGRSSGVFPSYVRLDINHRRPPEGWDQGSKRCIICDKNWPNLTVFVPTPCCDAIGGTIGDGKPDMTWPQAVSDLIHFRFEKWYDKWNEGASDVDLNWNNEYPVSEDDVREGMREIEKFISDIEEPHFHT